MIRYASVCSGIEAPAVALQNIGADVEHVFFSEIEKFPSAVLAHHFPDVPNLGDMTKIKGSDYAGSIDLMAAGTPCQTFSPAGDQDGLDDERGQLTIKYFELVGEILPRWFVWENVRNVLSNNDGRDFETIIRAVAKLGYGFAYRLFDAQHFGVPQRRRRIFLVGYRGVWQRAAAVLFEPDCLLRNPPPSRETRQESTTNVVPSVTASGRGVARVGESRGQDPVIPVAFGGNNTSGPIDIATACNAKGGSGRMDFETETFVAAALCASTPWGDHDGRESQLIPCAFNSREDLVVTGEQTGALGASLPQSQAVVGALNSNTNGNFTAQDALAGHAVISEGPKGSGKKHLGPSELAVRRLMPIECERLQGFQDNYTRIPWGNKPAEQCPDGHRYAAIGNSIAVPCLEWIFRRLLFVDSIEDAA